MEVKNDGIVNGFERLASIRHKLETTFIEQIQQNTKEKFFLSDVISSSMDLIRIAVDRRYSFEKDVFSQLRGKSPNWTDEETQVSEEVKSETPEIVQVITVPEDQTITIPLTVQNHDTEPQEFTMHGGDIIELEQGLKTDEQLTCDPSVSTIEGGESEEVKLVMQISEKKFAADKRYISSFTIKSKYEKKMNVLLNIVSRETLGDKPFPIIRMLHT